MAKSYQEKGLKKSPYKTLRPLKEEIDDKYEFVSCKCMACGEEYDSPVGNFYKNTSSPLWKANDGFVPVCMKCIRYMLNDYSIRFGLKTAVAILSHYLDLPFSNSVFETANEGSSTFTMGTYTRYINISHYSKQTFLNTLVNGDLSKAANEVREEAEAKWSDKDIRNKNFVISTIGYDPYDDDIYSGADRKFLFNTLSGYLEDDVVEDGHRLQSAINIAPSMLQRNKIDRLINEQLSLKNADTSLLKTLGDTKASFDRSINASANENGFSLKTSGAKKHANTLTGIMREMIDSGFEECKVNSVDAKYSIVLSSVANVSNRNLFDQLNYQEDDYARMVATQRELIQKYEKENAILQEENRIMKRLAAAMNIEIPEVGGQ